MNRIITQDKAQEHNIDKYKFKVLAIGAHQEQEHFTVAPKENAEPRSVSEGTHGSGSGRDELVESLLKKTDEISSNFIKMQMKLEDKEIEFKKELERVQTESFNKGLEEGKKAYEAELQQSKDQSLNQYVASVNRLESTATEFKTALEGVKQELTLAALEIAKEVIEGELHEHSSKIAAKLSSALIAELSNAAEITLKVNPKDHGVISERVSNLKHVTVVSDSAVSPGGVVAISNVGNIDSEVMKRYERIKKAALSG
jgi:flagellar assembly protein FliH